MYFVPSVFLTPCELALPYRYNINAKVDKIILSELALPYRYNINAKVDKIILSVDVPSVFLTPCELALPYRYNINAKVDKIILSVVLSFQVLPSFHSVEDFLLTEPIRIC